MNEKKQLSVILPVYNAGEYLENTIESVLQSVHIDLELIIINDGSTDNSEEICRKYSSDPRVVYFVQENKGVSSAREKGMQYVKGEYLTFIDSDDYVEPDMYDKMYSTAVSNESEIVSCGFHKVMDTATIAIRHGTSRNLCTKEACERLSINLITHGRVLNDPNLGTGFFEGVLWDSIYKTEFIMKNHFQFISFWNNEDDYLFKIQCYNAATNVSILEEYLYYYRVRSDSLSRKRRYIDDLYSRRCKGREYIYKLLAEVYSGEKQALQEYKDDFERKILLMTLYNETVCNNPHPYHESIRLLKNVRNKEKSNISKGLWKGASFVEKGFLILLFCRLYRCAYIINRYLIHKYR